MRIANVQTYNSPEMARQNCTALSN
jgi:hypothetical protein